MRSADSLGASHPAAGAPASAGAGLIWALVSPTAGVLFAGPRGVGLEEYVEDKTRGVRTKAAEGVRAVEEKAGKVLDRGRDTLRRADEFLQDTKEHMSETLRAGRTRFARPQQFA